MDLQALFKRKTSGPAVTPVAEDPVQEARTRARRRLVGAALLLVGGVIAFPLLFETQPRPVALNTPIQVGGRDAPASAPAASVRPVARAPATASAPASAPAERVAPVEPEPPATPPERVAAAGTAATATAAAAAASAAAPATPAARVTPPAAPAPAAASAAAPRVETIRPAPAAPAATAAASEAAASAPRARRYVVQVGAFGDPSAAREVRLKVEKLGLKTYTQVVEVEGSKRTRVRVGPYERREEAQKVAERLKAAGLTTSTVLAL